MDTAIIKEQLHEYIERADNKHVQAIYTLLEKEIADSHQYDDATITMLNKRREDYLSGTSKSYTREEVFSLIRKQSGK